MPLFVCLVRTRVLCAWLCALACTAQAQHRDPAPLPSDVVRTLVNATRAKAPPAYVTALRSHLDNLMVIAGGEDGESQRMLLSGKRNELGVLRGQAQADLAQTRARLQSLGLTDKAQALDEYAAKVDERFERLSRALAATNTDRVAERSEALQHLRSELQVLHSDVAARERVGQGDAMPNFSTAEPPPYRPVVPSNAVPMYVAQKWANAVLLASSGNIQLAAAPSTPTEAASCGFVAADKNATADAPLAPEITALAEQLGYLPARIFEYVHNNIRFEPYYGSLKGAVATLYSKAGGPTDQASLLIALLRASNIPARYVRGQVEMSDSNLAPIYATGGRVAQWVGAKSYVAATKILGLGKFNPLLVTSDGTPTGIPLGVRFNHVWVEACVPYGRYRGAALDFSGHRWIPLDPSYKDHTYQPGISTIGLVNVDTFLATYMNARSNGPDSLPHEAYAKQLEIAVRAANPNNATLTVQDVPYKGTINPLKLDILPNSLPFEVVTFTNWPGTSSPEIAQLPADHRYRWFIHGLNNLLPVPRIPPNQPAGFSLYLPDVALKRVTLSFKGATPTPDQTNLSAWQSDGNINSSPCSTTINVVPVIMVDGATQVLPVVSGSLAVCSASNVNYYNLSMNVGLQELNPSATPVPVTDSNGNPNLNRDPYGIGEINYVDYTNIGAINWHALQAYAFQGSDTLIAQRAAKLLQAVSTTPNPNSTTTAMDATQGEFLHMVGLKYMRYITEANLYIGGLDGGSGQSGNHLGLVSSQMKVQYLFDLPFAVNATGILVDVAGGRLRNVDINTGAIGYKTFLLSSYTGSAYESYVLQENVHTDAVSTVRGLQFAKEPAQSIEILTLTSANWGNCTVSGSNCWKLTNNANSTLNYSSAEVTNIYNKFITKGYKVTMPRSLIAYSTSPSWKGDVFLAELDQTPTSANATFGINKFAGGWAMIPDSDNTYDPITQSQYISWTDAPQSTISSQIVNPGTVDWAVVPNLPGANGVPPTSGGDPVNMVSGNMYHVERDISIKGRGGFPIVFERSYNSQRPADGPLGFGWTHSFNQYLKLYGVEGGKAKLSWIDGTGRELFFATSNHTSGNITLNTTIPNPAGIFVTFRRHGDGTYRIREKSGLTYKFANVNGPNVPPGPTTAVIARLLSITDRTDLNGDALASSNALTLNYATTCGSSNLVLCSVTDAISRSLTISYTNNRITQVQDFSGRQFRYEYDASGNLVTFRNPLAVSGVQNPVTYSYYTATDGTNLNHLMKQYTLPRGNGMRFEYYANGRTFRHTVVLTNGGLSPDQVNTFTYNDFRRETVQTNERGHERRFFFDPYGNLVQLVEENGAVRRYTYDCTNYTVAPGTPVSCPNPHNRRSKTDPTGLMTGYEYDASGNVIKITTPRGATVEFFDFTAFNRPRRIQDAADRWTINRYDAAGNLIDVIKTAASYTPPSCAAAECVIPSATQILSWAKNGYDTVGNLTSSKRVRDIAGQIANNIATSDTGPIMSFGYDANLLNAMTVSRRGIKNSETVATTQISPTLQYDSLGRLTNGVDADWYPTQFLPDAVDRLAKATDRFGKLRSYDFDPNGNLVGESLQLLIDGKPTLVDSRSARYDDSDRRIATTDAGGSVTSYQYDAAGNVERITSPDNYVITLRYDEANRVAYAHDEQNHVVSTTRDTDGRVRTVTDPNGNTVSYDYYGPEGDGRLKRVTYPRITNNGTGPTLTNGKSVEYEYDANGNVVTITEIPAAGSGLANRVTRTSYNERNQPVRIVSPEPAPGAGCPVVLNTYDALSRLTKVDAATTPSPCTGTTNSGVAVQMIYAYDDFGRLIKSTDALGRLWSYTYDANNNLKTATDPKLQITTYNWKLLPAVRYLEARVEHNARTTTYTRNLLGQVTRVAHPEVTYDYSYDVAHRLMKVTDSRGGKSLTYSWSPAGRLNSVTDSDDRVTRHFYDPVGRLSAITAPNGDTASFRFDDGGRLIEKRMPNGVYAHYTYYEDNSIKQVNNGYVANNVLTALSQHDYTYDGVGNRKSHVQGIINNSSITYSYTYDALNRLTRVTNGTATQQEDYTYDALGNRLTKQVGTTVTAYVHDAANQLKEIRSGSPTGTLQATLNYDNVGNLTSDGTRSYIWDTLNQLSQVTSGFTTVVYGYDSDGRRVKKTTGGVTTNWLYDGQNIHSEYGSTWTTPAAIYTFAGLDRPLTRSVVTTSGYGQTLYYASDGLGSVIGATNSTDTTVRSQRFDAWGNKLASSGAAIPQYSYTGREPDETGIVYYRARYYNPATARFVSRDPIGLAGGINQYAYVDNNPVNFTDPSGLLLYVSREGNNVNLQFTVVYTGPAANYARVDAYDREIKQVFSGPMVPPSGAAGNTYQVTTNVTSVLATNPAEVARYKDMGFTVVNLVNEGHIGLSPQNPDGTGPLNRSNQSPTIGFWNVGDSRGAAIAGHEALHIGGHSDRYDPLTGQPFAAWMGNIAAEVPGSADARNIAIFLQAAGCETACQSAVARTQYDGSYYTPSTGRFGTQTLGAFVNPPIGGALDK